MEKNEYTPTTPQERAALAEAREREARRQKALAAGSASPRQAGTAVQSRTAPAAASAVLKDPARAPAYTGTGAGAIRRSPANTAAKIQPRKQTAHPASKAAAPSSAARTVRTSRPAASEGRGDTNEFPAYVHTGIKGGYKPPKPKKRRIAPYRRKKLDPRFRAAILAVGALFLIFLILFFCGVRYTSSACSDGRTVKFFGIVREKEAQNGWITVSGPDTQRQRGRLTDGNTITYSDGSVYTGSIQNFKKGGQGTLTYANGDVYEGQFADDQINGVGKLTYASGDVYEGNFENGLPSGTGKLTYADGSTYEGQFAAGRKNGAGVYTNGASSFEGTYVNDVKEGYGKQTFANGDVYEGNYKNDMRNGQGTYTFANGETYTGGFKDNQLTGEGTYTWPSGRTITGVFENGVIVNSSASQS